MNFGSPGLRQANENNWLVIVNAPLVSILISTRLGQDDRDPPDAASQARFLLFLIVIISVVVTRNLLLGFAAGLTGGALTGGGGRGGGPQGRGGGSTIDGNVLAKQSGPGPNAAGVYTRAAYDGNTAAATGALGGNIGRTTCQHCQAADGLARNGGVMLGNRQTSDGSGGFGNHGFANHTNRSQFDVADKNRRRGRVKIARHRRCAGRKGNDGADRGGSVECLLLDAALIGNDVALGCPHGDIARYGCAAGNCGGISQRFSHNTVGIDLFAKGGGVNGKNIDRDNKGGAATASIHVAGIGFDKDVSAVESGNPGTVNVDGAQGGYINIAATGGIDAQGNLAVIAHDRRDKGRQFLGTQVHGDADAMTVLGTAWNLAGAGHIDAAAAQGRDDGARHFQIVSRDVDGSTGGEVRGQKGIIPAQNGVIADGEDSVGIAEGDGIGSNVKQARAANDEAAVVARQRGCPLTSSVEGVNLREVSERNPSAGTGGDRLARIVVIDGVRHKMTVRIQQGKTVLSITHHRQSRRFQGIQECRRQGANGGQRL